MKREGVEFQRKSRVGNDLANVMLFFSFFYNFVYFFLLPLFFFYFLSYVSCI